MRTSSWLHYIKLRSSATPISNFDRDDFIKSWVIKSTLFVIFILVVVVVRRKEKRSEEKFYLKSRLFVPRYVKWSHITHLTKDLAFHRIIKGKLYSRGISQVFEPLATLNIRHHHCCALSHIAWIFIFLFFLFFRISFSWARRCSLKTSQRVQPTK